MPLRADPFWPCVCWSRLLGYNVARMHRLDLLGGVAGAKNSVPGIASLRTGHRIVGVTTMPAGAYGLLERRTSGLRTRVLPARSASECMGLGSRSLALRARKTRAPTSAQLKR